MKVAIVSNIGNGKGGASTRSSSMATHTLTALASFHRANGSTCFCPDRPTAHAHRPGCGHDSQRRTVSFSPLLAFA